MSTAVVAEERLILAGPDLKDWNKQQRLVDRATMAHARKDRGEAERLNDQAAKIRKTVTDRLTDRIEGAASEARTQEIVGLEAGRGAKVVVSRDGRVAVITRAGLKLAYEAGYLEGLSYPGHQLYEIGKTYRDCFERIEGESTPTGSGTGGGRREALQHSMLDAGDILRTFRATQSEPVIKALDQVCGHDITINAAAISAGCHRLTMSKRLREGLEMAAKNWIGRKDRTSDAPFSLPSRVELAARHEAIRAAQRGC